MFGPEWTDAELLRHFPGSTSDGRTHGPSSGLLAVPNQSHWFSCCHLPPVLTGGSSWRSANLLLTAAATLAVNSRRRRYPPEERAFQEFGGFARRECPDVQFQGTVSDRSGLPTSPKVRGER